MFSRRQRTKQSNSFTFERINQLFEVAETQSIVKISVRFIFETESSHSQSMTDVQNTVFFSENMNIDLNLIDDVTDQNDFIEKMKLRLTIIKIEKRRAHLRHRLIQMKTKKKTDFSVTAFEISKSSRKNVDFQAIISLKKSLKSKTSELYSDDTQKFFDK